jgi:hypothetical protein
MNKAERTFRQICKQAETAIMRGHLTPPCFLIYGRNGTMIPFMTKTPSLNRDDDVYRAVKLACIAFDANMLGQVMEARGLRKDKNDPSSAPAESEDNFEAIIVAFASRRAEGRIDQFLSSREIIRDAAGQVIGLGPEMAMKGDRRPRGSLVSELLPPRPISPEEQAQAKTLLASLSGVGLARKDSPTGNR